MIRKKRTLRAIFLPATPSESPALLDHNTAHIADDQQVVQPGLHLHAVAGHNRMMQQQPSRCILSETSFARWYHLSLLPASLLLLGAGARAWQQMALWRSRLADPCNMTQLQAKLTGLYLAAEACTLVALLWVTWSMALLSSLIRVGTEQLRGHPLGYFTSPPSACAAINTSWAKRRCSVQLQRSSKDPHDRPFNRSLSFSALDPLWSMGCPGTSQCGTATVPPSSSERADQVGQGPCSTVPAQDYNERLSLSRDTATMHRKQRAMSDANNVRLQVIVLDDEPDSTMLSGHALGSALLGYNCSLMNMECGQAMLDYLETCLTPPDIVLLALAVPGMSALDLILAIRSKWSSSALPIILMSNVDQDQLLVEGLEAGANDYVIRPCRLEELACRMNTHLALRKASALAAEASGNLHLLKSILPANIISKLKGGSQLVAEHHKQVTILFTDIKSFTTMAQEWPTERIILMLNEMFTAFDQLCMSHDVYKVETIGDAYMVVSGHDGKQDHAVRMMNMAAAMIQAVQGMTRWEGKALEIRVGVHTGPAHSGVVGVLRPHYSFFGDTVNTASRMESNGFPMAVHVSEATRTAVEQWQMNTGQIRHTFMECGPRTVKGKGIMHTHLLKVADWQAALSSISNDRAGITASNCLKSNLTSSQATASTRRASVLLATDTWKLSSLLCSAEIVSELDEPPRNPSTPMNTLAPVRSCPPARQRSTSVHSIGTADRDTQYDTVPVAAPLQGLRSGKFNRKSLEFSDAGKDVLLADHPSFKSEYIMPHSNVKAEAPEPARVDIAVPSWPSAMTQASRFCQLPPGLPIGTRQTAAPRYITPRASNSNGAGMPFSISRFVRSSSSSLSAMSNSAYKNDGTTDGACSPWALKSAPDEAHALHPRHGMPRKVLSEHTLQFRPQRPLPRASDAASVVPTYPALVGARSAAASGRAEQELTTWLEA